MHPPSLVQLATAHAVYLFQLPRMDVSAEVAGFFGAPEIVKVGISMNDDLRPS